MQSLRRFSTTPRALLKAAVTARIPHQQTPIFRRFQTTLIARERSEEAVYFQALDEAKKAQIRANLEKMLASHEMSEDKQDILEILGSQRNFTIL